MTWYSDQVLPRVIDRICASRQLKPLRARVTAGLAGQIVEVGFGSGLNVEFYPSEVDCVMAVEPASTAMTLAERRLAHSSAHIVHVGVDGGTIPLDDASCDGALMTFTL